MAHAKNLSGGQKRKLSVGIAILGDPKVRKSLSSWYISFSLMWSNQTTTPSVIMLLGSTMFSSSVSNTEGSAGVGKMGCSSTPNEPMRAPESLKKHFKGVSYIFLKTRNYILSPILIKVPAPNGCTSLNWQNEVQANYTSFSFTLLASCPFQNSFKIIVLVFKMVMSQRTRVSWPALFPQPDVSPLVWSQLASECLLLQILLLDEPTAGMDPSSRHQVWSLLKSRRAGRVIVLCTHYMDEADILAGTDYLLIPLHFSFISLWRSQFLR